MAEHEHLATKIAQAYDDNRTIYWIATCPCGQVITVREDFKQRLDNLEPLITIGEWRTPEANEASAEEILHISPL